MLMGWSSLLTVPQVMLMSLLLEHGQLASLIAADERGWLALAYTIFIGGIVGFGLWFWLIARCSMGRVAPFGLLLPVFALISSVLFLGDRMTPKLIVGGLLAIAGVAITQARRAGFKPRRVRAKRRPMASSGATRHLRDS
jgi:O-acetylserine/cysteine efflux transporter